MDDLNLIYITKDIRIASICEASGVNRIMVDLEKEGKKERQAGRNTLISDHNLADVVNLRGVINQSKLWVRINPISSNSKKEIDDVISAGADALMLPMADDVLTVSVFSKLVDGRARRILLLETIPALIRAAEICTRDFVDEVHIGLNDMHIDGRLNFMFELMSSYILDSLSTLLKDRGIPFGIGGVAPISQKSLLSSRLIISQHARLGSNQVIMSRAFNQIFRGGDKEVEAALSNEIIALKQEYRSSLYEPEIKVAKNYQDFKEGIDNIVANMEKN